MRRLFLLFIAVLFTFTVQGQSSDIEHTYSSWHPSGDYIASATLDRIYVRDRFLNDIAMLIPEPQIQGQDIVIVGNTIAWSPDGTKLANLIISYESSSIGQSSRLVVWDVATWDVIFELPDVNADFAFSPDSQLIAIIKDLSIIVVRLDTQEIVNTISTNIPPSFSTLSIDWHPTDQSQIMITTTRRHDSVSIVNVFDGSVLAYLDYDRWIHPQFNPNGEYIVLGNLDTARAIDVVSAVDYSAIESLELNYTFYTSKDTIHWLSNMEIGTSTTDGTVVRWNILSDEIITFAIPENRRPAYWSPDGSVVSVFIDDPALSGLYLLDGYTGEVLAQRLETDEPYIQSIFLSDGVRSLSNGTTINLAQIADPTIVTALTEPDTVESVLFELSGSAIVTQIDNTAPYELSDWELALGTYTLTITPYPEANGTGTAGIPMTIDFTVVTADS